MEINGSLKGKKLLLLGGGAQMVNVTKLAQEMGCEVHIMDYYDTLRSPAKLVADAYSDLSIFDTDAVVGYIKENGIDGVMTGFTDSYLFQYKEICEKAGLPYYGSETAFGVATDKMLFKQACRKSGVGIIPGTNAYDFETTEKFAQQNGYPLMIKPTDNSGSRGVIKCEKPEELRECYEYALSFSKSRNIIVERFMDCDSVVCSYQLAGEDAYLSAFCDRYIYTSEGNGAARTSESRYPSDYLDRFIAEEDENIRKLFREHGFRDGMVGIMGFVDEKGFYWCEMTYRPSGGHHYTFINSQSGINGLALLIEFAVTGRTDSYDPTKEDPHFKDCCGMIHISGVAEQKIAKIEGIEDVRAMPEILEVNVALREGQTIGTDGTTAQQLLSVWVKAKDWQEYKEIIRRVEKIYKVYDKDGNSLVKPGDLRD
ncbi:MAG: hypothetical protein E7218_05010 [Anaerofustis stercorihominis]|nr:hypothetical protein [Anaerofustis stercorihominis]